mmetsp:Transcript_14699/g.46233  ORF Transcript_14699/g.46233 Transcript_14699/m.46233 type:complete len:264 (+) Transcript_14699:807-1598(+)
MPDGLIVREEGTRLYLRNEERVAVLRVEVQTPDVIWLPRHLHRDLHGRTRWQVHAGELDPQPEEGLAAPGVVQLYVVVEALLHKIRGRQEDLAQGVRAHQVLVVDLKIQALVAIRPLPDVDLLLPERLHGVGDHLRPEDLLAVDAQDAVGVRLAGARQPVRVPQALRAHDGDEEDRLVPPALLPLAESQVARIGFLDLAGDAPRQGRGVVHGHGLLLYGGAASAAKEHAPGEGGSEEGAMGGSREGGMGMGPALSHPSGGGLL